MGTRESAKRDAERRMGTSVTTRSHFRRASTASLLALAAVGVLLVGLESIGPVSPGAAAEGAAVDPTPPPSPSLAPPEDPEAAAAVITSPADGSAVTSATVRVSGTKGAGAGLQVQRGTGEVVCTVDPSEATTFSCPGIALPAGAAVTLRAIGVPTDGSDAGASSSITVAVVPPPTVAAGGSAPVNGLVRGTAIPGATVSVEATSGESCSLTADASGAWACLLTGAAPDGAYALTATQVAPFAPGVRSDPSASTRIVLDRTAPVPPVITTPSSGASLPESNARFAGRGEDGATVTVFVGSGSVCEAVVSSGRWSCVAGALPAGEAGAVAIQRDIAHNSSSGSLPVQLVVGGSTPAPTPDPTASAPRPTPSEDGEEPSPAPSVPPAGPEAPDEPGPPPPAGAAPPEPPDTDAWDAATPFSVPHTALLPASADSSGARVLVLAALVASTVALAAVLHLRGAPATAGVGRTTFTGRNRRDVVAAPLPSVSTSSGTSAIFALLAVAGLLILSRPVDGTPAYARLLFASVTATVLIALVSVAVPAAVSRLSGGGRVHTAVDARGFLIVAGAAGVSRLLDLDPPVLFALVLTATTATAVGRATEGRVAGARIVGLATLGVMAWIAAVLLPPGLPPGFASSLAVETLNVLTAASLGSATIMLVPLGTSTGRSLWAASRLGWLALAIVVVALEILLLGSRSPEAAAAVRTIGVVGIVACVSLCLSVWIWRRFVAPVLADER